MAHMKLSCSPTQTAHVPHRQKGTHPTLQATLHDCSLVMTLLPKALLFVLQTKNDYLK